jgi:hypothetical protein
VKKLGELVADKSQKELATTPKPQLPRPLFFLHSGPRSILGT